MTLPGQSDREKARALIGTPGHDFAPDIPPRLAVHPDVAEKFIAAAIADGAQIPNPPELDGAFRLALGWAYAKLGGDVERF